MFTWTFVEYTLHRFVFHYEFSSKTGQTVHFLIHGVHHEWPNDGYRLVMPLAAAALIAVPFSIFYYSLSEPLLPRDHFWKHEKLVLNAWLFAHQPPFSRNLSMAPLTFK